MRGTRIKLKYLVSAVYRERCDRFASTQSCQPYERSDVTVFVSVNDRRVKTEAFSVSFISPFNLK